ncbi:hypothetical protein SLA2020_101090 [Shorea laevis]
MGFKDLHCFNLAMLAQQAWRILQNPQSLWVQVLKSLYFIETSFFLARKGSHPSWAWTSILKGREILHLGVRWNVGDGRQILTYEDAWIPTLPQFKVSSSPSSDSLYIHVCDLLDASGNWDVSKLSTCFTNEECKEIAKIPTGPCPDNLVWHYNKFGKFTVKSAHFLAYKYINGFDIMEGNNSVSSAEWKHLWKLKLPPKVKVFLWRAMLNRLPTLDNLLAKGVVNNALCQTCQLADESLMHILLYCPHVEPIWFGSALGLIPRQLRLQNFVGWWRYMNTIAKQNSTPFLIEQWAVICWNVWKARNKKYFEQSNFNPNQVLTQATGMFQEYCLWTNKDLLNSPKKAAVRTQVKSCWTRPPPEFMKINVDASYVSNCDLAALAMVGRNFDGELLIGRTWRCSASSPLMAEASALLKAIQYATDMGLNYVIFESDNEALISYAQEAFKPSPWEISSIIRSIRGLSSSKPSYSFSFVPREGNRVADWVARATARGQCPYYWAHCPPNILLSLLFQDTVR